MEEEKNLLRKVKIKLGRAEVEVVSEKDEIEKVQAVAEELAGKIKPTTKDDVRYIG
jgi:hypothetical protein